MQFLSGNTLVTDNSRVAALVPPLLTVEHLYVAESSSWTGLFQVKLEARFFEPLKECLDVEMPVGIALSPVTFSHEYAVDIDELKKQVKVGAGEPE